LLTKIDIASMQHAVEGRSPFLDHKLVELASSIPLSMKYRDGVTKHILRTTFADILPQEIQKLPKRGFVVPVESWIRNELKNTVEQSLLDSTHPIYEYLNFSTVAKMYAWHLAGYADYSPYLWRFFMLAEWYKIYFL